jgi:hypothetical protein
LFKKESKNPNKTRTRQYDVVAGAGDGEMFDIKQLPRIFSSITGTRQANCNNVKQGGRRTI